MRIFDRYVIRQVALPFVFSLLLLTFLLTIQPFLKQGYPILAAGVNAMVVGKVVVTLLPQALAISIPMAVLLSLLVALGRLSGDREFVAMQACGVSIYQLLPPLAVVAVLSSAATAYVMIVARPDANQTFRDIIFKEVAQSVERNIKPRVLFTQFPNNVLYVRDIDTTTHVMHDVFFADNSRGGVTTLSFAREGQFLVDRTSKIVQLQLTRGNEHVMAASDPAQYQANQFGERLLTLDAQSVFKQAPAKNPPEMSISELKELIAKTNGADAGSRKLRAESQFLLQYEFAVPAACLVLALVALALGVSNRKDGMLASFAIGFIVVFVFYVLMFGARSLAIAGKVSGTMAPWFSVITIGVVGVLLTIWRAKSTDRPPFIAWAMTYLARRADDSTDQDETADAGRGTMLARTPVTLPWIKILDMYVSRQYIQVLLLAVFAALGIFYISTFIDLAGKLFSGKATGGMLVKFFYYTTPQYLYYIIPIAVLVATLVTIGVMTKNSELIVMRACGMSLYRAAAPLVLFAILAGLALFALQERVLDPANRRALRLEAVIRDYPSQEPSTANRWIASTDGDIYHYDLYDPNQNVFTSFARYHIDQKSWRLSEVVFADHVTSPRPSAKSPDLREWTAGTGWVRALASATPEKASVSYTPFTGRALTLEAPAYFSAEQPDPEKMSFQQLRTYIAQLRASGFNTISATVQLHRKIAFPCATVIMALLAIPFAVTTGRRGAMYGIGIGIALSIAYWVSLNVFSALGEAGVLTPTLAAWSANIFFGAAALYGLFTVRT